jgi:glycosyltransferase involved in cell wall biosynthesis
MFQTFSSFSLLIVLNGSLATKGKSVGGGDAVMFKFVRLSKLQPDVLLPHCAQDFVATSGRFFLTRSHVGLTMLNILTAFSIRIVQGMAWDFRNKKKYDIALAASPFGVDVIPVWFWKARHKGAVIYHLIPKRKPVNFATRIRFGLAAVEQKIMLRIIRRACDFIVAGNEATRQELAALMPEKTFFILPAGFDAAAIDAVKPLPKDFNLGCFVGRLVSQKGIFDLVKVMAELQRSHPKFRLIMAGTGPEQPALEAEIRRLNLTNIQLAGFLSETEKISLLQRAQYFFFPSYEEGWGIALAEALYCECRCICYELPHYRSIFGDYPGYARLGDTADFVRAFQQSSAVTPEQKKFMRQYDDPLIARQLADHLAVVMGNS